MYVCNLLMLALRCQSPMSVNSATLNVRKNKFPSIRVYFRVYKIRGFCCLKWFIIIISSVCVYSFTVYRWKHFRPCFSAATLIALLCYFV